MVGAKSVLFSLIFLGQVPNGGPLWFLFAYLLVLYNMLSIGFAQKQKMLHMVMIVCALLGAICSHEEIILPFNLNTVFTCLFLFHSNVSRVMKLGAMKRRFDFWGIFSLLTIIWIVCVLLNYGYLTGDNSIHSGAVMLYRNKLGNWFYFMIGCLTTTGALAILSRYLSKIKLLPYLGRNSLTIMALHYPMVMFITVYFQHTFLKETFTAIVITSICPILIGVKNEIKNADNS